MKPDLRKRLRDWCPQPKNPTLGPRKQTLSHNMFNREITPTKIALLTLMAIMCSSAFILIYVPANYYPTYAISAEELATQPATYFVLNNPDAYVSQAISKPETTVWIKSMEDTQIDELINAHNTGNIQVNQSFYQIGILHGDSFPPVVLSWLYLASLLALPISAIAIATIITLLTARYLLTKKSTVN